MISASLFSYIVGDINVILPVREHSAGGYLFRNSGCWLDNGVGDMAGLNPGVTEELGVISTIISFGFCASFFELPYQVRPIPTARTATQNIVFLLVILIKL